MERLQEIGAVLGISSNCIATSLNGGSGSSVECVAAILLNADALSASHKSALHGKLQFISKMEIAGWFLRQTVRNPSARNTQEAILEDI